MARHSLTKGGITLTVVLGIVLEQFMIFAIFHELGHVAAALLTGVHINEISLTYINIESSNVLIDVSGQISGVLFYSWFVYLAATTPKLDYRKRQRVFFLFVGYLASHALTTPITYDFLDMISIYSEYRYSSPRSIRIIIYVFTTAIIYIYFLIFVNYAHNLMKKVDKKESRPVRSRVTQEAVYGAKEHPSGPHSSIPS